jgi:hypothetical protein
VNIDPEMGDRSRAIGFRVAYVTFILSHGLIIARFGLWGLLFGWLPAAAGSALAGYVFYRSPLLCLILEASLPCLHAGREQGLSHEPLGGSNGSVQASLIHSTGYGSATAALSLVRAHPFD